MNTGDFRNESSDAYRLRGQLESVRGTQYSGHGVTGIARDSFVNAA
jgi:hypothetical protein